VVGTRSHMCHGGWEVWVHGVTAIMYISVNNSYVYVSYYVCGTSVYTKYLSYTYALCYNIQEYGICSFCNWYIN